MNELNQFLALLFLAIIRVALLILVFTYGWGLEPLSWAWIIGGGVFGDLAIKALATYSLKGGPE